ncbi:MAG: peptidase dimerization domain-containing protein [Planctomycetaceae bacterium]|nr:peptidase dimerization domain-containing protein [Planctomycetaceae bacterium]
MRPVCLEGSDGFVTSTAAPIATGWSDPVAGWELHPLKTNTLPRRTLDPTPKAPRVDIIPTATGPGGHSSIAPDRTAIGILSVAIDRLERNPLPTELPGLTRETLTTLAPVMGIELRIVFANLWLFRPVVLAVFAENAELNAMVRTTAAVTVSKGGDKDNVLPETAMAKVNFRLLPGTTPLAKSRAC